MTLERGCGGQEGSFGGERCRVVVLTTCVKVGVLPCQVLVPNRPQHSGVVQGHQLREVGRRGLAVLYFLFPLGLAATACTFLEDEVKCQVAGMRVPLILANTQRRVG